MRLLPLLLVLSVPGLAQAQPRVLPSRDVTVIYKVSGSAVDAIPGGMPAGTVRIRWSAAEQKVRVDAEGRTQILIVDLRAPRAEALDTALRTAMSLPVRSSDVEAVTLRMARLTKTGHASVAGHGCTEYSAKASRGHGSVCLTEDGVALRATGEVDGRQGDATAVSVTYGNVPAEVFEVPKGYFQLALPRPGRPQ